MYGSAVVDVRSELKQSRHLLRKVVFSSLGIPVFFFFFLFKQLIGIPFNYLNQISSSFLNFGSGSSNVSGSLSSAIQQNQFVQAVMVFVTGILAVCTKFLMKSNKCFSNNDRL